MTHVVEPGQAWRMEYARDHQTLYYIIEVIKNPPPQCDEYEFLEIYSDGDVRRDRGRLTIALTNNLRDKRYCDFWKRIF